MSINYSLIGLIDFLGIVQGLLLGTLLIAANRKNRASLLIGFFLITYSIELLPSVLQDTGLQENRSYLQYLPTRFLFLSPVLLFLYAKSITRGISVKKHWFFFIPAVFEFTGAVWLYFSPSETKAELLQNAGFSIFSNVYFYGSLVFTIVFCVLTIKLINDHQKKILEYFSNTKDKQLKWVNAVATFLIVYSLLWFLPLIFVFDDFSKFTYAFLSSCNVVFIFWAGLSGLRQSVVDMSDDVPVEKEDFSDSALTKSDAPQSRQVEIDSLDKDDEIFARLTDLVESEALFTKPDLTLPFLANELKVTRKSLSHAINQKTESNFNHFINQYRVVEAKKKLEDPTFDHLNMLGIAYEVGFNSKATFFSVFKKMTGIAPGAYKKRHFTQK